MLFFSVIFLVKLVILTTVVSINDVASDDVCSHEAEWCPDNYYCDIASKRCRPCSHVCDVFRDDKMCDKYCDGKRRTTTTPIPNKIAITNPSSLVKTTETISILSLCEEAACKSKLWNIILEVTLAVSLITVVILLLCFMRLYHRAKVKLFNLDQAPGNMQEAQQELGEVELEESLREVHESDYGGRGLRGAESIPLRTISHASQTIPEDPPQHAAVEIHQHSGIT